MWYEFYGYTFKIPKVHDLLGAFLTFAPENQVFKNNKHE